jgi:hypothetical protein
MVTRTRKRGFELTCRAGLYVHLSYPVVHMIRRTAFVAQICESKEMCHGPFGTETLKCVCAMVSIKACSAKDMALANLAREFDAEKVSGLCSGVTKCVCALELPWFPVRHTIAQKGGGLPVTMTGGART